MLIAFTYSFNENEPLKFLLNYCALPMSFIYCIYVHTVRFIKPYRYPVYKCTGSRQGFMKWAIYKQIIVKKYL